MINRHDDTAGRPIARRLPQQRAHRLATNLASLLMASFIFGVMAMSVEARSRKPSLPPGVDPGGVAVAIASPWGIDYTRPEMARRMARDGEGELLGWDFVDNDRQPFEQASTGAPKGLGIAIAQLVLGEAGRARIMPLRIKTEALTLGRMVAVTGQSPARVLLVQASSTSRREDWLAFAEAATHFKNVLIVMPAAPVDAGATSYPAGLGLANVLTVVDADPAGRIGTPMAHAEIAAVSRPIPVPTAAGGEVSMSGPGVAAARVAALAARLLASAPATTGAALKARILALAKPLSATHPGGPVRWMPAPDRAEQGG